LSRRALQQRDGPRQVVGIRPHVTMLQWDNLFVATCASLLGSRPERTLPPRGGRTGNWELGTGGAAGSPWIAFAAIEVRDLSLFGAGIAVSPSLQALLADGKPRR
jgi:hypothetical protein